MLRLQVLGSLDLRREDGGEVRSVLAQPKRVALLTYLALARPGSFHRRDTLSALFWPEADQAHARASLRQALYFLRRSLADGDVLETRGEEEVRVRPEACSCDAVAFGAAVERGDWEGATDLYAGDLLEGFFVPECPDFEKWLDEERGRLRRSAGDAAWARARELVDAGELAEAERTARRALALCGAAEIQVCSFVEALADAGDRAAALRLYREFEAALADELELEPAPETRALASRLSSKHAGMDTALAPDLSHEQTTTTVPTATVRNQPKKGVVWVGAAAVIATLAAVAVPYLQGLIESGPRFDPDRAVVVPLQNRTGDPALDEVGVMAADWIGQALQPLHEFDVVPAAYARQFAENASGEESKDLVRGISERTNAGLVVSGAYYAIRDSLHFRVEIIDTNGDARTRGVEGVWHEELLREAIITLGQRVSGALASERDTLFANYVGRLPNPPRLEAYRQMRMGYDDWDRGDWEGSLRHHLAAYALDTTLIQALVSASYVADDRAQRDSLAHFADARRHMLSRMGQLDLDLQLSEDRETSLRLSREKGRLSGNGWSRIGNGFRARQANLPHEALDALSYYDHYPEWRREEAKLYWHELGSTYHILGDYNQELVEARRARAVYPDRVDMLALEVRALAALGRVEDLKELLNQAAGMSRDPAQADTVAGTELRAHGHADASQEAFERAVKWLRARPSEEASLPENRLRLAFALYGAERWEEAREVADELALDSPDDVVSLAWVGRVAARLGDRATALEISEQIAGMSHPESVGRRQGLYAQACIAALLGQPDEAMRLLWEWFFEGGHFSVRLHREMDLESLRGRDDYREFMRPKG